jgi:hypothetical protein
VIILGKFPEKKHDEKPTDITDPNHPNKIKFSSKGNH